MAEKTPTKPQAEDHHTKRSSFVSKYLRRIGLDPSTISTTQCSDDSRPTRPRGYELLCQLTQAHVGQIPFENLAQHGGKGGGVQLDLEWTTDKILDRHRGGFCLELNALFGTLLSRLGFEHTILIPAIVYKPDQGGFDHPATHIILIVTIPTTNNNDKDDHEDGENDITINSNSSGHTKKYFVDVGFGEPPIHPLVYDPESSCFGTKEQVTPDGMRSRLTLDHEEVTTTGRVVLEWFQDGVWKPRLAWNLKDSLQSPQTSPQMQDFQPMLDLIYGPDSIFSRKLIACRITQDQKVTLAGNVLKETGPPRFGPPATAVTKTELTSLEDVREALFTRFQIPMDETEHLDLSRIVAQDPSLFANF